MSLSTRDQILECGYDLFSRHGFHGVGLDRILAEVGVTKTTFYNHFESKDDLVLAVIDKRDGMELQRFQADLQKMGGRSARGQLEVLFEAMDMWFNDPEFRGCIFITAAAEFPSPNDPAHQLAARHKRLVWEFLLELATEAEADDPHSLAEQLALLIEGAVVVRHVAGNDNAAQIANRTARLLLEKHLPASTSMAG
jgi:AcrR family transcriptional regulator